MKITIEEEDTIASLKQMIYRDTGIEPPFGLQREGQEDATVFVDEKTLIDNGLASGAVVCLLTLLDIYFVLPPGMCTRHGVRIT